MAIEMDSDTWTRAIGVHFFCLSVIVINTSQESKGFFLIVAFTGYYGSDVPFIRTGNYRRSAIK